MTGRPNARLRGAATAGCVAVALLAGCAGVPTDGPVVQGEGYGSGEDQGSSFVNLVPVPPQPGMAPTELVREFLASLGSFDNEFGAARAYMTSERQSEWRPEGTATVYDGQEPVDLELVEVDEEDEVAQVQLNTSQVGAITGDGQFRAARHNQTLDVDFELRRVDGEWRISDLPRELLLSSHDVNRVYRTLNLYYLNTDQSMLVPDTVQLPLQSTSDLANRLVNHLVAGPTQWAEPAVSSAFPAESDVAVAYQSGQLTVDFSSALSGVSNDERYQMAAQLAWTLKQLPEVQEFRILADGDEVEVPGAGSGWLETASVVWDQMDPSGLPEDPPGYLVRDGQLLMLDENMEVTPAAGAAGTGQVAMENFAVSLNQTQVAGITAGRRQVMKAELAADAEFSTVLEGGEYLSASWDGLGNLWVVEAGEDGEAPHVWMLEEGTEPVEVSVAAEEPDTSITSLRISRDGTRAAVLVDAREGGRLFLARIIRSGEGVTLGEMLPLATDLASVASVAWRAADQLAVLGGTEGAGTQSYLVPTGGTAESTSAGAVAGADMQSIAAAPGAPILAGADDDYVWVTNDRLMWQRVAEGASPVFPG